MNKWYVLDKNKNPVPTQFPNRRIEDKRVASTTIGKHWISTVFLSLDHGFEGGRPILFETLVFGPDNEEVMLRCCTWDEALKQHELVASWVQEAINKNVSVSCIQGRYNAVQQVREAAAKLGLDTVTVESTPAGVTEIVLENVHSGDP